MAPVNKLFICFDKWYNPKGTKKIRSIIIIATLMCAIVVFVYFTGGVKNVYSHSMYVPILLSALIFDLKGGIVAGLIGGLLLGPLMPLDTITGTLQDVGNWLYRTGLFVLVGALFGLYVKKISALFKETRYMAYYDPVTGEQNLNYLINSIEKTAFEATDGKQRMSLIFIEIDNYYEIAYTFGIDKGINILKKVCSRLKLLLDNVDLYQINIDRFAVLIHHDETGCPLEDLIYRLKASFRSESFESDGFPIYVDIKLGLAHLPDHGDDAVSIMKKAGIALHSAKKTGKFYSVYNNKIDWTSKENITLLGELPDAIENNQLVLYYQPKVNISNYGVNGFEALIR